MCNCYKRRRYQQPRNQRRRPQQQYDPISQGEFEDELNPELEYELIPELSSPSRNSIDYIKWVQTSLNRISRLQLKVDGIIGTKTRNAIRSFQTQNGLAADGIVDPATEAALITATGTQPGASPVTPTAPAPSRPMVDSRKVSCLTSPYRDAIFRTIGTNDPVAVLEAACQRAVAMLSNTIAELTHIKTRIAAGDPIAWPLLSDILAWSLKTRMLMRVEDRSAWTGSGTRNAGLIIRWLTNIRNLIAGRDLWYTCLGDTAICTGRVWAWVWSQDFPAPDKNFHRIHLCLPFWHPGGPDATTNTEYQAQIIIHETSHIYYNTSDQGMGPGRAECIAQFISDANNSPIRPGFIGQCGAAEPSAP
jgi:hypothetical protein